MRRFLPLVLLLLALVSPAWALDSRTALADYHHDIWSARDGAPGEVTSMAQSADGWLWLGSTVGLYRFDGVRFRRFEPLPGETAPARPVTALTALRDGDLLIGYHYGGLSRLHQGHLIHYPGTVDAQPVGAVLSATVDTGGVLWAATGSGLLRLEQGRWRNAGKALGLPPGRLSNLVLDQYGQLWMAAGDQLLVLTPGAARLRTVLRGYITTNLGASPDGRLWLDTHARLVPVPPQHRGPDLPRPAWLAQAEGQESGLFDRDGNYWALGCPGLCRSDGVGRGPSVARASLARPDSRLEPSPQAASLGANILFEDRDGNLWVGSQSGVERWRHNRLAPARLQGGERYFSLARDGAGQVLTLTRPNGGLWRLARDGRSP
ncbi:ligand-binding sensor domain-containing protein, partial [Duganella callida]